MKRPAAIVGSLIFLVIAPGVVGILIPWTLTRWRFASPFFASTFLRAASVVLIAASLPILLDSFRRFVVEGLGTPAPVAPTEHLVVGGMYRFVRNPMYVAVVSTIVGQALLFGSSLTLAYGLCAWLVMHLFVLTYEEPTLRKRYGNEYAMFSANVPRWIPRVSPWSGASRL